MDDNIQVVLDIEAILLKGHKTNPKIDDKAAYESLSAALQDEMPQDRPWLFLVIGLKAVRERWASVPVAVWDDCLRTVIHSMRRHSRLREGETSYLEFVSGLPKGILDLNDEMSPRKPKQL